MNAAAVTVGVPAPGRTSPTASEQFVLSVAQTLFENGEDTSGVLSTSRDLGDALGQPMSVIPRWGEIGLQRDGRIIRTAPVVPWIVNMRRVTATLAIAAKVKSGQLDGAAAAVAMTKAASLPASSDIVFAIACALGAPALLLINGGSIDLVMAIVGGVAFFGGLLRRWLGRIEVDNGLPQLFAASLLAGVVGGAATLLHIRSSAGLIALGPLMVLVPGPALLGAAFDLLGLRIPLGMARLAYGLLAITALSAGVTIGTALAGGVGPGPQVPAPHLTLWLDMTCAAIASGAYAVFFSMPWRLMLFPVVTGACAHGVRWFCLSELHLSNAAGAGLACLFAGIVVEPVTRKLHLPFAAVGFASVVAQVPGTTVVRISGGLVELQRLSNAAMPDAIANIFGDAGTALLTFVAMALGLAIPKSLYMRAGERSRAAFAP